AEQLGALLDAPAPAREIDTQQSRVQLEGLAPAQRALDDGLLEDDARDAARLQRLLGDVVAREARAAAGWRDGRGEDADGRRLTRSVWPEQAEDLAGVHVEVDALYRLDASGVCLA